MTLLTIVQNAADEVGLSRPSSVIGSTDNVAIRALRYAQRTGQEFVKRSHPRLIKETTITTSSGTANYAPPSDFDHFVPVTHWNRTTERKAYPIHPAEWQLYKSGLTTVTINDRFRIKGADGEIYLHPTPSATETVAYEYVSKNFCESAGETGQSAWAADTDVGVIDENLFELGVIWRLLHRLGLDYSEERAEYERRLNIEIAQVLPTPLYLTGNVPRDDNLPDSDFPS